MKLIVKTLLLVFLVCANARSMDATCFVESILSNSERNMKFWVDAQKNYYAETHAFAFIYFHGQRQLEAAFRDYAEENYDACNVFYKLIFLTNIIPHEEERKPLDKQVKHNLISKPKSDCSIDLLSKDRTLLIESIKNNNFPVVAILLEKIYGEQKNILYQKLFCYEESERPGLLVLTEFLQKASLSSENFRAMGLVAGCKIIEMVTLENVAKIFKIVSPADSELTAIRPITSSTETKSSKTCFCISFK